MTFPSKLQTDEDYIREIHDVYGQMTREQLLISLARCWRRIDELQQERNRLLIRVSKKTRLINNWESSNANK